MADTLATLKEQHQVSPVAPLSQILAPRYMTRSRACSDVKVADEESSRVENSEDVVSITTAEEKPDLSSDESGSHTTISDSSSTSDSPVKTDASESLGSEIGSKRKAQTASPINASASQSVPSARKRGRHKEYTAPTGVWKTNGGYISTIYVGNRRIYGPLRDNPQEAGYDRQRLIEAKAFVKSELEMRNFIATLKTNPSSIVASGVSTPIEQSYPTPSISAAVSQIRKVRPVLTTVTSTPLTIDPIADNEYSTTT
jgi:hypothetical protein